MFWPPQWSCFAAETWQVFFLLWSQLPQLISLLPSVLLKQPLDPRGVARGAEPVGVVAMLPSNVEEG